MRLAMGHREHLRYVTARSWAHAPSRGSSQTFIDLIREFNHWLKALMHEHGEAHRSGADHVIRRSPDTQTLPSPLPRWRHIETSMVDEISSQTPEHYPEVSDFRVVIASSIAQFTANFLFFKPSVNKRFAYT